MIPKEEKISSSQLLFLSVTLVSATAFLFAPAITSAIAGNDGWISVLIVATVFGFLVTLTCVKLAQMYPDQTLIEYAPKLIGKIPGKLLGLVYILFIIHINAIIVREFGDFLFIAFLPETPLMLFNLVVVLLAAYATRSGLEVIARMNQFVFPLFLFVWFVIVFFNVNNMNFENLLPLLDHGIKPILKGSLTPNGWRGELFLILMFFPHLNRPVEARNTLLIAVVIIGVILTGLILASTMVFGAEQDAHFVFPSLALAKYISIGDFLERVEALIVIVWVAGITVKVAIFYLASVNGMAQLMNLKSNKPVVIPIGIITLIYSAVVFDNSRELVSFLSKTFPCYAYLFEFFIPLALLFIAFIRKKAGLFNA